MKLNNCLILAVILLFACALILGGFGVQNTVAVAQIYGSYDTAKTDKSNFWYYSKENLNVAEIKSAVESWQLDKMKNPVIIAVVDTGLHVSHEVFSIADVLYKKDGEVVGYNSYVATKSSYSSQEITDITENSTTSHGTSIASIMAMLIKELGLEDYIKLYPIKASYLNKNEAAFTRASVKQAIKQAQQIGAEVINLSICATAKNNSEWAIDAEGLGKTILSAAEKSIIVAAAGNDNLNSSQTYFYPAAYNGVVSVMGYQSSADGVPSKSAKSNYGAEYDLIAPSVDVISAKGNSNEYFKTSGTSAAAALTSVIAAVLQLREQIADSGISANVLARHLVTSNQTNIVHNNIPLPKLDAVNCLSSAVTSNYLAPIGIEIDCEDLSPNGVTNVVANQAKEWELTANLMPYGDTDPAEDAKINWYILPVSNQADDNSNDVSPKHDGAFIGNGKTIKYKPDRAGEYKLLAVYQNGDTEFIAQKRYSFYFNDYSSIADSIKVVLSQELRSKQPQTSGVIYVGDSQSFSLVNIEYVDSSVEIKWFVNDRYVASGTTFSFAPTAVGEYVITAQYGNYRKIEKTFTATVKPQIAKPLYLGLTVGFGSALLVAAAVAVVFIIRKKHSARTIVHE